MTSDGTTMLHDSQDGCLQRCAERAGGRAVEYRHISRRVFASIVTIAIGASFARPVRVYAESAATDYATRIGPLLLNSCGSCHGESRQKGGLALHSPEAIAKGSDDGVVFVAGKPDQSEIVLRLRLPLDADGHMPPKNKPQPSEDDIHAIEAWIAAGAAFGPTSPSPATQPARAASTEKQISAPAEEVGPADAAALGALSEHLVNVEVVAQTSNRLRLNFAAAARTITEAEVVRLLRPILPQLDGLSLARCKVGDETAALLGRAPQLRHADLRGSRITDAGLAALSHAGSLRELVLAQTHLTDAAVDHLAAFPGLQRAYLWKSGLSAAGIARLRQLRPKLQVNAGDFGEAAAREVEPEFKLTSDAPPPGEDRPAAAPSKPAIATAPAESQPALAPQAVNVLCPVSGKPVNTRYTIIYQGRLISFCCPNCPAQFWADPARFEGKTLSVIPAPPAGKK